MSPKRSTPVSYTHLRAHETVLDIVCRLLLEKKKNKKHKKKNKKQPTKTDNTVIEYDVRDTRMSTISSETEQRQNS